MITEEERQSIINEAVEKTLLKIPEVVGNLISTYADRIRTNERFYNKYPEFNEHRQIVASAIEELESKSPGRALDKIVEEAVPVIRKRLKSVKGLDSTTITKPDINESYGEL
jgi:hypothetical protein